jgi:hypothetical protein
MRRPAKVLSAALRHILNSGAPSQDLGARAAQHRLPAVYGGREFVEAGGVFREHASFRVSCDVGRGDAPCYIH